MPPVSAFRREHHRAQISPLRRDQALIAPGFGKHFTDHMVLIDYTVAAGWHDPRVVPYAPFTLDPATTVLHYAQEIYEGLKVFAQPDGSLASFRPERNAARLNRSASRLGIPALPEDLFMAALRELVAVDAAWVPTGSDSSLYVRPFIFATEVGLGLHASASYTFCVIASPSGPYFQGGVKPVSVWWSKDFVRAAPGGTGAAKFGGNYAASLAAQAVAIENGCDQVVWLDAAEHRWVEEMGGMNLFFVFGSGPDAEVVTPELTGTLLPGITRDSLLVLSRDLGYRAVERRISITEWADRNESGELTEVFACGTAAVITPVGAVVHDQGRFFINGGKPGPITLQLRRELTELQYGNQPDPHQWMTHVGWRIGDEGAGIDRSRTDHHQTPARQAS